MFVEMPGQERSVPSLLAGAGAAAAVLFAVAADVGWSSQSARQLAMLDALGIRRGLLVVTRADLADPGPALSQAGGHIAASGLGDVEALAVSAVTGQGLPELLGALGRLAAASRCRTRAPRSGSGWTTRSAPRAGPRPSQGRWRPEPSARATSS